MLKALCIGNVFVTLVLAIAVTFLLHDHKQMSDLLLKQPGPAQVIRTNRLEIVDSNGQVRGVFGVPPADNTNPYLEMRDQVGHQAVILNVSQRGDATMYLGSEKRIGAVSVGYLWGSDSLMPGEEDSLASWGIRINTGNGETKTLAVANGLSHR